MREQGNGRSGPDTEIHRNRWQLAAKRLCDGRAGYRASISGNRSDEDAIGGVGGL